LRHGLPYAGLTYKHDLITENISLSPQHRIAEIGVGTGYSCLKLASEVAGVVGFDRAADLIETLEAYGSTRGNVVFVKADVTRDDPPPEFVGSIDTVYSVDTLNYIRPPSSLFSFTAKLLKPSGAAFIAFPNELDDEMEGVTNFKSTDELRRAVSEGGLACEEIKAAEYTAWFDFINRNLWYRMKKLLYRSHYDGKTNPQVFDETVAFKMLKRKHTPLPIRAYTAFIMTLLRFGGIYEYMDTDDIYGRYVLLKLRKIPEG
jgi:SAM-dependent methyltransferase